MSEAVEAVQAAQEPSSDTGASEGAGVLSVRSKARNAFVYVWTAIGVCVLTGVSIYLLRILSVPVSMLIWTLIFVFCLRGVVNKLDEKGMSRALATAISYAILFAVLAGIGFLMFSPAFGLNAQFANILESIPGYMDEASQWMTGVYDKYSDLLGNETIEKLVQEAATSVTGAASSLATNAANTVVDLGASWPMA